jgi:hypothetical protein
MSRAGIVLTAWLLSCLRDPASNIITCSLWTIAGLALFFGALFGMYVLFVKLGTIWRVLGLVLAVFFLVAAVVIVFG